MAEIRHTPHEVDLSTAATYLELDEPAVRALVAVGYLRPITPVGEPMFELADLKAFIARNADNGSGNITNLLAQAEGEANSLSLLDELDSHCDEMARRAFDIFSAAFPE